MRLLLLLLYATTALSAESVPKGVRDTDYDWRCYTPSGPTKGFQRQDLAVVECQNLAIANPGDTYYVQGGTYRYKVGTIVTPPPPPPPPVNVVTSTGWLVEGWKLTGPESPSPEVPSRTPDAVATEKASLDYPQTQTLEYLTGLGLDNYVVRAQKKYTLPAGRYSMWVGADDGVRVFVGSTQIANKWVDQSLIPAPYEFTAPVGEFILRVEHYENRWAAGLSVSEPAPVVSTPVGSLVIPGVQPPTENEDESPIRPPLSYQVALTANGQEKSYAAQLSGEQLSVLGVPAGQYTGKVRAVDATGEVSSWARIPYTLSAPSGQF